MALTPSLNVAPRNAACDAVVDLVDAGSPPGLLRIYDGTMPANAAASLSGNTLLGTLTFSTTAFGASSSGVATASAITSDTSADATGTATFHRVLNAAGTVIWQGSVGTSGCDLNINSVSVVAGGTLACSGYTYTQSAS